MSALTETAARAADAVLRSKADDLEAQARRMDDHRAKPDGFHKNSLDWFQATAPKLREDAQALRAHGRALLVQALEVSK